MNDSDGTIHRYVAICDEVRSALGDMTREQLAARPVEGKWSAMEVLCHLVDTDLATANRIRMTLIADRPRLNATSREMMTRVLMPGARDAEEELTVFQAIRSQTARIIDAMPPDALDREAVLVKAGGEEIVRSVRQLLSGITQHVSHHLAFVREKRTALGLTNVSAALA